MSFKFMVLAFASVTAFAVAHDASAQETGGTPVPDHPTSYDLPPSTGGGGGRPGLRLGTGADVQFGGPRDAFVLPESQILYRADDQIGVVLVPIDQSDEAPGADDYDPPDYLEDCAHPWHGVCPCCDDLMSESEATQLADYEARLAAVEARVAPAEAPAIPYDTPRFDGFSPDLALEPAGGSDW